VQTGTGGRFLVFGVTHPSGAAEHRSKDRMTLAPCLSVSELRERRALREAQGTRAAGKPPGSPFFWILFFGGAKKSISPEWAK